MEFTRLIVTASDVSPALLDSLIRYFDGAPLVEEFKHVSLMRLAPGYLHCGNRSNIEAIDDRRILQRIDEVFVASDRRNRERIGNLIEHFSLRNLDDDGVWAKKLP